MKNVRLSISAWGKAEPPGESKGESKKQTSPFGKDQRIRLEARRAQLRWWVLVVMKRPHRPKRH